MYPTGFNILLTVNNSIIATEACDYQLTLNSKRKLLTVNNISKDSDIYSHIMTGSHYFPKRKV